MTTNAPMSSASLFKPAENTSAYLKAGLMGFAGSGKTKTASKIATGLVQHIKGLGLEYGNRPAFFIDTETGSDWVAPDFKAAGIELYVAKTRAFVDLIAAIKEAEKHASILVVDSLTHFWKELCDSYMKAKRRTRLEFQDWSYLKGEQGWAQFSDLYVNSGLHIVLCGRAGFEYDYFEDDAGKKNLEKTGIKMKAEAETGFEPSLLILMERHQRLEGGSVEATWRTATVLKDRSTLLDGKEFINPDFKHFLPHIARLNLGGKQLGVDATRSSAHTIAPDKRDSNPVQRRICLDEIQSLMVMHVPGQAAADKQRKIQLLRTHFGATWTEMEEVMPLIDLRAGFDSLHRELEGAPSRYAELLTPKYTEAKPQIDDAIPDFDKPAEPTSTEQSPKEQLLAQLAALASPADLLHWGLHVSTTPQYAALNDAERQEVSAAVLARQNEIAKNTQKLADDKPVDGEPQGGKRRRAAAADKQPELAAAE